MIKPSFFRQQSGTATLEFAVVLPLLFMVTFMTLLYLFWMGDAMLQSFAGYKHNHIASKRLPVTQESAIIAEINRMPTMNLFQQIEYQQQSLILEGNHQLSVTRCFYENSLLPSEWLRLAFLADWNSRNRFERMLSYTISIQEPYIIIHEESP